MQSAGKTRERHVLVVSDATGDTCEMVVKAALSQFADTKVILERVPEVRSVEQVSEVIQHAASLNAVVIYTMVSVTLRQKMFQMGRVTGVPTVDILGPILTRLSDQLEISPLSRPGLFQHLDHAYFGRLEAVDFTVKHDDGLGVSTLADAEIVLVGISRTSKTPVSLYLSFRGWKIANVPIVVGIDLPKELFNIDQRKVIGFNVQPALLHKLRMKRQSHLRARNLGSYTNLEEIESEIQFSRRLFSRHGWPVIDVTAKAIEEISTEVLQIIFARTGQRKSQNSDP